MGVIKDLVDLVTQLNDRTTDRKFGGELRQVQSMIGAIQSEHAEIHEKRIELMTENAKLRETVSELKTEIQELKQKLTEGGSSIVDISSEEQEVLLFLKTVKTATARQIAAGVNKDQTKVEYWAERLRQSELIYDQMYSGKDTEYFLAQNGKAYLIENNLI